MNTRLRSPSHQGIFYPAEPEILQKQLDYLLTTEQPVVTGTIKAMVVPHAAYDYSGRVAGQAYAALSQQREFNRIIILAPNHQNNSRGALVSPHDQWATPLGKLLVDQVFVQRHWKNLPYVTVDDATHQAEYSIEVQLPFLQQILPDAQIVPVLLGETDPSEVCNMLQPIWDDEHTLIIISSDLYHYLPREAALREGMKIAGLIENNEHHNLGPEQACGYVALRGLMHQVEQEAYFWRTLTLQHSGQDNRFRNSAYVGYGAFLLLSKTGQAPLSLVSGVS